MLGWVMWEQVGRREGQARSKPEKADNGGDGWEDGEKIQSRYMRCFEAKMASRSWRAHVFVSKVDSQGSESDVPRCWWYIVGICVLQTARLPSEGLKAAPPPGGG